METLEAQGNLRMRWNNKTSQEWSNTPWKTLEKRIFKLQKRIYRASQRHDSKVVRKLQRTLVNSWSAKMLAVRKVTQENRGKRTAGTDGILALSPQSRMKLVRNLKISDSSDPIRRVWIPKPGKKEKRGLGIPTIKDRALQALVTMALEPEWEAKFEGTSYGFRPGRSTHDAIAYIYTAINKKPKYVLDADITQCFDRIDHDKLLTKLNASPKLRRQIRAWLKARVLDKRQISKTEKGTPQGGNISPLLANIALHGLEEEIKAYVEQIPFQPIRAKKPLSKRDRRKTLNYVRYADDFIIMHEDLNILQQCREVAQRWLGKMGLELKPEKTRIAHTLERVGNEEAGFNFLGFNIQQHRVGKHRSGSSKGIKLGFKTLIKPSKEAIKSHYKEISETISRFAAVNQEDLIRRLNPKIRGWTNYYSGVVSKKVFARLGHIIFRRLWKWAVRRHPNKSKTWIKDKYFQKIGNNNWRFCPKDRITMPLIQHDQTPISRHTMVKLTRSPYDGDYIYWCVRRGKYPGTAGITAKLIQNQKGKCPMCGLHLQPNDYLEKDHITPKAMNGSNKADNLQILHKHCHDRKTQNDIRNIRGNHN